MHVAPIQKYFYTVHTQVYEGSNSCHKSQLGQVLMQHSWYVASRLRGWGRSQQYRELLASGMCVPWGTVRPLPILDPLGERSRDKVCRKSTSVTTGSLPGWSSVGQASHAPRKRKRVTVSAVLQTCEALLKVTLLVRLPQLCDTFFYCPNILGHLSAPTCSATTHHFQFLGQFCSLRLNQLLLRTIQIDL